MLGARVKTNKLFQTRFATQKETNSKIHQKLHLKNPNLKIIKVYNLNIQLLPPNEPTVHMPQPSSAFLFPKKQFSILHNNTISYISDNIFYRLNLETGKSEITLNRRGRSYQAFTVNHKRGLAVLADYGKNPIIDFEFLHRKEHFQMKDVCALQIDAICLSLDCKFLLVCTGIPEKRILVVDVEHRKLLKGGQSYLELHDRKVQRLQFNPSNSKVFAIMYKNQIQIYTISQAFSSTESSSLEQNIKIQKKCSIQSEQNFQTFLWDQLNNIYVSNGKHIFVYSTDTEKQVINYDLEGDFQVQVVANFVLTQKHLIIVYCNGRMEWVNKYYPDLMQEEDIAKKPFYLQKYYEFPTIINYATYNHQFSKIFVAHKNGFFSILNKQAESNEAQDEQQDNKGANKDKKEKDKKLDVEVTQVGPCHANHIVFCREVKGKAILMTISRAGRIVLWSIIQKKPIAYLQTSSQIASADVNQNFTILCTSDHTGSIQFYSISDFENIFLFKQFRLTQKGQINQVVFSSNSKQIACLSTENKRIFYLLTDESHQIQMLGYVTLTYTPISICWNKTSKVLVKPKFEHLLCCIGFGIVMINGPAATSVKLRGKEFQLNCQMFALRTDLDQKLIQVLPTGEIIATGSDKILKKYKQPEDPLSKFNPQSKSAVPPPLEQIEAHDLEVTFMKVSNRFFISGGADGTLQVRPLDNFNSVKTINVFGWKNANLFTGAVSDFDGLFYACGKDGALCMWKTKDLQIKSSDQPKKQKSKFTKIKSAGKNLQYFEVAIQNEYLQKMKDTINKKKRDQLEKITKIKTQLKQLLAENQTHQELQKLGRDEFVIDIESRDRMTKIGQENCEKIKKQSLRKVLHSQVYRNKLKQLTWDQMQEHLRAINGIKNNFIVYNYQIRKLSGQEKRTLQIILDLRKNQLRQMKKRGTVHVIDPDFYKNKNIINGGVLQPLILTVIEKKDQKKDEKTKKKKEQEAAAEKQPEETQQIPKDEVWQLLYSSFQLFSDNAKRNQIVLMKNIIVKIKQAFNKQFNKLLKLRQSQNQMINDKNKRIIEICDQLKKGHEVIVSNKNILENPDRILEVNNKQIPFARYLSRQEREKLEKQRLKEQERLRALAEDDSSQRALQKMMGGTLEEKKTSVLEVTVEREKWMDKPLQEMSEQQKNKLKEYEQKKQKAEQQKQRIVKKLEAELRKLKLEIDDIMQKYDEKLFALLRRRIEYDLRIEQQELYCIKLSLSMANFKDESEKYKSLKSKQALYQKRIKNLQNQRDRLRQQEQQLQKSKQTKKASLDVKKLGDHQGKIKTIQKITFQQYMSNIKKRREVEQNLLKTDTSVQNQIITLDPMKQIQSKILSSINSQQFKFFIPDKKKFMEDNELSEQMFHLLEVRFNAKRQDAEFQRKLKGVKESIKKLEEDISKEQNSQQEDQKMLENIQSYLEQSKSDLQVLFRIKKGFVEIDSQTPVPRLEDSLLISKSQIDQKNLSITQKANLKIGVMTQIKTCKISVTQLTLQLQRQQTLINQLSTMIKQVQMLKVKKQMQTALSKKDTKINENQLRSLKEQIEKVRKEGQKRINLFEKKIQKVIQEIQSIKKQNKQLEVQKWNLENTVKQREKIKDMMVGQNGKGNQQAAEKFEQISINRKLFDKAKQQTDQIELLRQELSKLKAKTFANFSSVQR